jgi:hypothetical protein
VLLQPIFAEMVEKGREESSRRIMIRDVSSGSGYPFVFGERRFLPAVAPAFVRGAESMLIGRGFWVEAPVGMRALGFDADGFPVGAGRDGVASRSCPYPPSAP